MAILKVLALVSSLAVTAHAQITLSVDLRDARKKIVHATETIPVTPGPMVLAFPKWIPGEHMPSGPIDNQAGFFITAAGTPVKWERDPLDMFSYHVNVPAGVTSLTVKTDYLATASGRLYRGRLDERKPRHAQLEHARALSLQRPHDACVECHGLAQRHSAHGLAFRHRA